MNHKVFVIVEVSVVTFLLSSPSAGYFPLTVSLTHAVSTELFSEILSLTASKSKKRKGKKKKKGKKVRMVT